MASPVLAQYVVLNGLNLGTRAHLSQSMRGWWSLPQTSGSGVRMVPGVWGAATRPVQRRMIRFTHPLYVSGLCDPDGVDYDDPVEGFRLNMALLDAACAPAGAAPWTVTAVHHLPDGGTRTGQVQVLDVVQPRSFAPPVVLVTLDIQVPSGMFEYAPPPEP
jgi:hypothetical protein